MSTSDCKRQIWGWDVGIGDTSLFNVAYLTADCFYIRNGIMTAGGKDKLVAAIEAGGDPEELFPKPKQRIRLDDIRELRHSEGAGVLEIHHSAKHPETVYGKKDPVHADVYAALRTRVAPDVKPVAGTLTRGNGAQSALIGLMISAIAGGVFIWWSTFADPNPNNRGRRSGIKNLIDIGLSKLGVGGTIAVVAAIVGVFAIWFGILLWKPRAAEVVEVRPATE